jgi:hypothetical protein
MAEILRIPGPNGKQQWLHKADTSGGAVAVKHSLKKVQYGLAAGGATLDYTTTPGEVTVTPAGAETSVDVILIGF